MEELILNKLSKKGKADFTSLRYDLPITTDFKPAFENLQKLKLVLSEKQNNETIYFLSQDGIDANIKGLEKWAEEKIYNKTNERSFILTKCISSIEIKALRSLENKGLIYEVEKGKYKIVPNKKFNLTPSKNTTSKKILNNKKEKFYKLITKHIAWWILFLFSFLAIIEYRFHYVANGWEYIINYIK